MLPKAFESTPISLRGRSSVTQDWTLALVETERYRRQFERLVRKYHGQERFYSFAHHGVSLSELVLDQRRLSRWIAREMDGGTYAPSPARVRPVMLDRMRNIFYFEALDFVVHGVVGELLTEVVEPLLSPEVYSYRVGSSSWQAVRKLAHYVRRHAAAVVDVRRRGLFVFRGDVKSYAESIVLGARSPLWPMLRDALGAKGEGAHWALIEHMIRPEIVDDDGSRSVRCRGLPLGSPITTPLLNLYLHRLDHELGAVPGAFYARFGDDVIFAHPEAAVVQGAISTINKFLHAHELELHFEKQKLLFFNGAGRPSPDWKETQGASSVVFLGCEIRFDGTIALPRDKVRAVLHDVRARVKRTARVLRGAPLSERGATLCSIVNETLNVRSPFAHPYAARIFSLVTSRRQLADIDHLLAIMLAEALAERRGVHALRDIPPRRLRTEWNLVSLVALRNGSRAPARSRP